MALNASITEFYIYAAFQEQPIFFLIHVGFETLYYVTNQTFLQAVLLFLNELEMMKFLCSVSHGYIKLNCSFCWAPGLLASERDGLPGDLPVGFVVSLKFAGLTVMAIR